MRRRYISSKKKSYYGFTALRTIPGPSKRLRGKGQKAIVVTPPPLSTGIR